MANKIISLNNAPQQNKLATETFSDISMVSKLRPDKKDFTLNKNIDVDAVKSAMRNIFTWIRGERILDPEFGTNLRSILYNPIGEFTSDQITSDIQNIILQYEPRVEIDKIINISNDSDIENNRNHFEIIWHIKGLPLLKYNEIINL